MDLFANANIKWMNLKWIFISISLILLVIGWITVFQRGGFIYGIDFKGGTIVKVKFAYQPDIELLRNQIKAKFGSTEVTRYDDPSKHEFQIKLQKVETEETRKFQKLSTIIYDTMKNLFDAKKAAGKEDINHIGKDALAAYLEKTHVLQDMGTLPKDADIDQVHAAYVKLAESIINFRNENGGLITDFKSLAKINDFPVPLVQKLEKDFYCGSFAIIGVDSVGPKIGKELQKKAKEATILALLGMLIYIAIRFKFAYGVGAIIALVHDVLITLGLFSLFNQEITLTVVAALLTLVGYSVNDSIVVFDRIRENVRLTRNENFRDIIDKAINQTLSRTIITSGTTFISVFCLWLFGGESLKGFSLVLVIGIIVGTYSSIAIASPILYWWIKYFGSAKDKKALKLA